MPEMIINQNGSSSTTTIPTAHGRWLDQQQYLIETYRQIRTNLGELEAEIDAARLRVTDWSQHRSRPLAAARRRSSSRTSGSTNISSFSCCSSSNTSCSQQHRHRTDCCSCRSSCSTTSSCCSTSSSPASCCCANRLHLPAAVAASLNAATLISAFLAASALHDDGSSTLSNVDCGSLQTVNSGDASTAELTTQSISRMNQRDSGVYLFTDKSEAMLSLPRSTDEPTDSTAVN